MKENIKSISSFRVVNWRRKINCFKYSFLELLALKINFFYKLLMDWRKPIFLNEIKLAKVTSDDKILLIGGGFLPSESMTIVETTDTKVVTIDNNITACKNAEKFVKKKNLSDKIIIENADGRDFPVNDFNVIFIAISVWPINDVFKNLSKNLKKNSRILCKSYNEDIPGILKKEGLSDNFKIESQIKNPSTKSFLFVKK